MKQGRCRNGSALAFLKTEIGVLVTLKILLGGLRRHTFQRIVAKSPAMMPGGCNAALLADDAIVINLTAKGTVFTGSLDFFAKQHGVSPFRLEYYT